MNTARPRHLKRTATALTAAVLLTLIWVVDIPALFTEQSLQLRYHIDYDVYREGATAFLAGDNLYTRDYQVRGVTLPFTYPPLGAILFIPLTWFPLALGAAVSTFATAALLWWCIFLMVRNCLPATAPVDPRVLTTWLLPLALLAEPVRETLSFGQINILLMALVMTDLLARRTWLPRGVLIGLAAAIKLTPAVFLLFFLVRRDWRGAATTVTAAACFTLLAFMASPVNSWTYWFDTLSDPGRIGGLAYTANQSFQGLLVRAVPEQLVRPLWLLLAVTTVIVIVLAMERVRRAAATPGSAVPGLVVLNSFVALLASPVSWSHHWVWIIPAVVLLGVGAWRHRGAARRLALALGTALTLAVFLQPHWWLPHRDNREFDWAWWGHVLGNSYVLLAALLIIGTLFLPRALLQPAER